MNDIHECPFQIQCLIIYLSEGRIDTGAAEIRGIYSASTSGSPSSSSSCSESSSNCPCSTTFHLYARGSFKVDRTVPSGGGGVCSRIWAMIGSTNAVNAGKGGDGDGDGERDDGDVDGLSVWAPPLSKGHAFWTGAIFAFWFPSVSGPFLAFFELRADGQKALLPGGCLQNFTFDLSLIEEFDPQRRMRRSGVVFPLWCPGQTHHFVLSTPFRKRQ